ncbi:MAG: bifunctional phosphoribosylaminoimidazolecarboxamide formyltransferase/IMP cyclohydrolase [Deltaproteobacteria bacterium]|nr:bifunctional phosphoribosylaminoimidazolecarboxamide formyltransferase/IMP cyclohydrolase [Deltaproteobacteria bacterium]
MTSQRLVPIRRALLSVTDKTGIAELGRTLHARGVELISTGGTAKVLLGEGLPVTDISAVTGNPEAFGGRMKTLSFQVASGLLFDRDRDAAEAAVLGIRPIDLVVANLYDFAGHADQGLADQELIEHIDIGGPTMIRAAAKNYKDVAVLCRPDHYAVFTAQFEVHGGTTLAQRRAWMTAAFALTARYDALVAEALGGQRLRYGENPHQAAVFLPDPDGLRLEQLAGKELSYNNLVDLDAAWAAAAGLDQPACAVVKHENPCGLAAGPDVDALLPLAWAGDPVSAFGSVVAFNCRVTGPMLRHLDMADKVRRKFVEIVAAPDFNTEALELLGHNKNLRVLRMTDQRGGRGRRKRHLASGTLVQDGDLQLVEGWDCKTDRLYRHIDDALFAFGMHAVRCLKSNAIAIVRRQGEMLQLVGMGAGQPNRVKSTELAVAQARANLAEVGAELSECVLASDAFFPFSDGPQVALDAGIRWLLEPGGSIRDPEVIAACNAADANLFFTGIRHFKH